MSTCWKPKQLVADALLEDEHEQPVGGSDREQVERDRDRGDHDRAERDREQDEAEPEHEGEHDREPAADDVEVVDVLRGRSADEDRRRRDRRTPAGSGRRAGGGSRSSPRARRRRPRRGPRAGRGRRSSDAVCVGGPNASSLGKARLELLDRRPNRRRGDVALDDDLRRVDAGAGEVAVQRVEALLGREAVGQRAEPRDARVDREHRERPPRAAAPSPPRGRRAAAA